ncbi:MAG: response regulator [Deltaproteobacteria bacterium]|nr:response regulator [Deltaproteobacteria bacterium]
MDENGERSHFHTRRGLILVDDDSRVLASLRFCLERAFSTTCAMSAEQALQMAGEGGFAAIVSDYQLPDHDGLWLLEELRTRFPSMLRVLVSGAEVPDLQAHLQSGLVHRFFAKPVEPERIIAWLTQGLAGDASRVGE